MTRHATHNDDGGKIDAALIVPENLHFTALLTRRDGHRLVLVAEIAIDPDDKTTTRELYLDLTGFDPWLMSGELEHAAEETLRCIARADGLDVQDAMIEYREHKRREKIAYKRQLRETVVPRTCETEGCSRPISVIDADNTAYCKRHARERGILPKGKIV